MKRQKGVRLTHRKTHLSPHGIKGSDATDASKRKVTTESEQTNGR